MRFYGKLLDIGNFVQNSSNLKVVTNGSRMIVVVMTEVYLNVSFMLLEIMCPGKSLQLRRLSKVSPLLQRN